MELTEMLAAMDEPERMAFEESERRRVDHPTEETLAENEAWMMELIDTLTADGSHKFERLALRDAISSQDLWTRAVAIENHCRLQMAVLTGRATASVLGEVYWDGE